MNKITSLMAGMLMLISACTNLPQTSNAIDPTIVQISSQIDSTQSSNLKFVSLQINPELDLIIDEAEIVVAVVAKNEDAEILMASLDLIGLNVKEAVTLIIEEAYLAGFINDDSEVVANIIFTVTGDESDETEDFENDLEESINEAIKLRAIYAIALNRKLVDESLAEEANQLGLTIDELLLKKLGERIGFVYDETLNYGLNVSNLVRTMNQIRNNTNMTDARTRIAQRAQEKIALINQEQNKRAAVIDGLSDQTINQLNDVLEGDMTNMTPQERETLRLQLQAATQNELAIKEQLKARLDQANQAFATDTVLDATRNLPDLEIANTRAMEAFKMAMQKQEELKISNQEALSKAEEARNKIKDKNPPRPRG
jgi:hypothetical protein